MTSVRNFIDRLALRATELVQRRNARTLIAATAITLLAVMFVWWFVDKQNVKTQVIATMPTVSLSSPQVADEADEAEETNTHVDITPLPEVERLETLVKHFESSGGDPTCSWETLLAIGDIYRRGAFPRLLPDDDIAAEIYSVAAAAPDGEVAGLAQARFVDAREHIIEPQDRMGVPIPFELAKRALDEARRRIQLIGMRGDIMVGTQRPRAVRRAAAAAATSHHSTDRMFEADAEIADVITLAEAVLTPGAQQFDGTSNTPDHRSDPQNVHDHGVVAASRRLLHALPDSGNDVEKPQAPVTELIQMLHRSGRISQSDAEAAHKVVKAIGKTNNQSIGMSEEEALSKVYQRICNTPDPDTSDALKEILVRQLASGVEHGLVVCSTGRMTRIASVFDGVEGALDGAPEEAAAAANSRPMWVVRQELASLASRVRDEYLAELTPSERAVYEAGGDVADGRHETAMRDRFEADVRRQYIDSLGMSAAVLAPIVAEMAEGF